MYKWTQPFTLGQIEFLILLIKLTHTSPGVNEEYVAIIITRSLKEPVHSELLNVYDDVIRH